MACSSGCTSGPHATYGECLRAKNMRTAYMQEWKGADATRQKKADRNLDEYERARQYGIQPKSTNPHHVRQAVEISEKTGRAYQA